MLKHIEKITASEKDKAQEMAGQLAALAYFSTPEAKALYRCCIGGGTALRRGVAKVLARNVDQPKLLKVCLDGLEELCGDPDQGVRKNVGYVFEHLPPPVQSGVEGFICKLLRSLVAC